MRLVYHRDPNEVTYQFFWVNPQNQRTSPVFYTEQEAKNWLINQASKPEEKPVEKPQPKSDIVLNDRYTEGYNAGKLYAELEYVEKKQEILELIATVKSTKILEQIKDLLK